MIWKGTPFVNSLEEVMSKSIGLAQGERPLRADARRNYDRILAAAEAVISQHGAETSLEEVARQAGVGSATLHRHFASRQALLEAVFYDRVKTLCVQAQALADEAAPGLALNTWLRAAFKYVVTTRGLAAALLAGGRDGSGFQSENCYAMIRTAAAQLLRRAQDAGVVRPDVAVDDLLTLMNAISLVTEQDDQGSTEADRLIKLVISGISTPTNHQPKPVRGTTTQT